VTAYSGATGVRLWSARGAVPEGTDLHPRRVYLTEGANLVGADPQTGRVEATASGSAVNGAAGVYVVRHGVALGLDQGGNGDAWGFDLAAERVTLTAPGLPWPHYFVDLGGVGGSADPAGNLVVIAACTQLAPAPPASSSPPASSGTPASSSPSGPASPDAGPSAPAEPAASGAPSASAGASASPGSSTPGPDSSPSAPAKAGQGCLHPELIALNL
jgi:hypothetical protein